jgi:HD superfamily phosphohydrolase
MSNTLKGDEHEPTGKVRCPVHGFIHFSKAEQRIIDHWTFQRLRHIHQLAMTYLVYPGAMHSRFEHSLGVMELTTRAFDSVITKKRERVVGELKAIPEFGEDTLERARQTVRLMALLHDIGHPAFSHAAEKTIPGGDHEKLSVFIIAEILGRELDSSFFPGIAGVLVRMMEKSEDLTFLRQFVASQMDMDRTDYLRRDSLHCGVSYGVFDSQRLIESLTVVENPDSGRLQLAISRGGEHAFEALILARYQMSTQVYLHRIRRIYDYYLNEFVKFWAPGNHDTFELVLTHDDATVTTELRKEAKGTSERAKWACRIVNRQHHRCILDSGDYADQQRLKVFGRVVRKLKQEFSDPEIDFYLDDAPLDVHKLSIPGEQQDSKVEDLYIVDKNGEKKLLTDESGIINKIPKGVRTLRIFAFPNKTATIKELASRARDLEKENS